MPHLLNVRRYSIDLGRCNIFRRQLESNGQICDTKWLGGIHLPSMQVSGPLGVRGCPGGPLRRVHGAGEHGALSTSGHVQAQLFQGQLVVEQRGAVILRPRHCLTGCVRGPSRTSSRAIACLRFSRTKRISSAHSSSWTVSGRSLSSAATWATTASLRSGRGAIPCGPGLGRARSTRPASWHRRCAAWETKHVVS